MMTLEQAVAQITKDMTLPDRFLFDLLEEGDWSFVVKSHAFLEALLTHALAESLHKPALREVLAQIDMSDSRAGKARFAEALQLVGSDGLRFLRKFSEIRNLLVHNVKNVNFSFSQYVSTLDNNQSKTFVESLAYFASKDDMKDNYALVKDLVLKDTKRSIWYSLLHFTGVLWWKKENVRLRGLLDAIASTIPNKAV